MDLSIKCEWTKQFIGTDDCETALNVLFYYNIKGIYDPVISISYLRGRNNWMFKQSINSIKELVNAMENNKSVTVGFIEIKISWNQERSTWSHTHMDRYGSSKFEVYLSDEMKHIFIKELKKFPEIMDEYNKEIKNDNTIFINST